MISPNRFTLTCLVLFAVTLTSVQSSKCALRAIQPELREIRKIVIHEITLVRHAAQQYTTLVRHLTDNITALGPVADIVASVRNGLDSFVRTADEAARILFRKANRQLRRASRRAQSNCPDLDVDPLLDQISRGLRHESDKRIQQQSNPRLYEIVGKATQKAVRGSQQALEDGNVDETNRITLVLRDVFALLTELFTVEIKDRQRQFFAFTEQLLLAAVVSAKSL